MTVTGQNGDYWFEYFFMTVTTTPSAGMKDGDVETLVRAGRFAGCGIILNSITGNDDDEYSLPRIVDGVHAPISFNDELSQISIRVRQRDAVARTCTYHLWIMLRK